MLLCSLEGLLARDSMQEAVFGVSWDMLVVDEAHRLQWSPESSSREYEAIATLSGQIPSVLLLTATPEQLGQSGHFARLRLLDPHRFHDLDQFLAEEQAYQPIAAAATARQRE